MDKIIITKDNYTEFLGRTGLPKHVLFSKMVIPEPKWCSSKTEQFYALKHNVTEKPLCECGHPLEFRSTHLGYRLFCSMQCRGKSKKTTEKRVATCQEKYGVNVSSQATSVKDKSKQTCQKKYGANSMFESDYFADKSKQTCQEKYDVDYPTQSKGHKKSVNKSHIKLGLRIADKDLDDYSLYKRLVDRVTNNNDLESLEFFEKRGNCTVQGSYNVDHMYSIHEGFKNNVLPCHVGHIQNLEMLPTKENISKGGKCSHSLDELINKILRIGDYNNT